MLQRLRRSRFLHSVLGLSSAAALSQLITIAATPALARLFSPTDFGVFAAFTSIATTLLVISSLRYELAVPLQRGDNNAKRLLFASLAINALIAFFGLFLFCLLSSKLSRVVGLDPLVDQLWLVPLFVFVAGSYRTFVSAAIRKNDYSLIGWTRISQALATVFLQGLAGAASLGPTGLIGGFVLGSSAGLLMLARRVWLPIRIVKIEFVRTYALLKRHRRLPKYDAVAAAADTLGAQLPSLLLASLFNPAVAGLYAITYRLLAAPVTLVGQAVGQVLLGSARSLRENGKVIPQLRRVIASLSLVAFCGAFPALLLAEPLFAWILGPTWVEAASLAKWIALGLTTQIVYSPISVLLIATDGQHINLVIHLLLLVAKFLALMLGYWIGDSHAAIVSASMVNATGYALAVTWLYLHVERYSKNVK